MRGSAGNTARGSDTVLVVMAMAVTAIATFLAWNTHQLKKELASISDTIDCIERKIDAMEDLAEDYGYSIPD